MYEGLSSLQRNVVDLSRRRMQRIRDWSGQLCLDMLPDDVVIKERGVELCVEDIVNDTKYYEVKS